MIELVIEQRRRNLGGSIEVGRVLPSANRFIYWNFVSSSKDRLASFALSISCTSL